LIIALLCLVGHIFAWWVPYFWGHYSAFTKQEYEFSFSKTIKILPPIKDHPIPDLEHMPVGILALVWCIAAIIDLFA
jgi:hypothetical protein